MLLTVNAQVPFAKQAIIVRKSGAIVGYTEASGCCSFASSRIGLWGLPARQSTPLQRGR